MTKHQGYPQQFARRLGRQIRSRALAPEYDEQREKLDPFSGAGVSVKADEPE
jgi:hypothetical protein